MAVYRWTYDGSIKKHLVEIEHTVSTGKLVVFLNRNPLVEAQVKDRGYQHHFYIDGELVIAEVVFRNNAYDYRFHEDERSESLRIKRAARRKTKRFWRFILFAVIVLASITVFPYWLFNHTDWYKEVRLSRGEGLELTAKCYWDVEDSSKLTYVYFHKDKPYYGSLDPKPGEPIQSEVGFPIWNGDEFEVRVLTDHPTAHKLDLSKPSRATVRRYADRVAARELNLEGRLKFVNQSTKNYHHCLLEYVREHYGIEGWAHIFFKNDEKHSAEYASMVETKGYQERTQLCFVQFLLDAPE